MDTHIPGKSDKGFTIRQGKLLLVRAGPINHQTQAHFWGKNSVHRPPVSRGMWAFPFGYADPFFYVHVFHRGLPKALRTIDWEDESLTDDDCRALHAKIDAWVRQNRRRIGLSRFWHDGEFYSHIKMTPADRPVLDDWFYWPAGAVTDWAKRAMTTLFAHQRHKDEVWRFRYARDHLELFIPGKE